MTAKDRGYQKRFYRKWVKESNLITQEVKVCETDILISSEKDIRDIAGRIVKKYRREIEDYIEIHPDFKDSLGPLYPDPAAPDIIKDMLIASGKANVGPMASVAGAISEFVGKGLLPYSRQIIVENGGDIFIASDIERRVAIFAGDSPLTNKLYIKVRPEKTPLGICTSSGTVGHSLSFGKADACVIIARSTSLADAVATAACNRIKTREDIESSLEFAMSIEGIIGVIIVFGRDLGVLGEIELL